MGKQPKQPKDGWFEPNGDPQANTPGDDGDAAADADDAPTAAPGTEGFEAPAPDGDAASSTAADADDAGAVPTEPAPGGGDGSVTAERDEYRDALIRVKADFDNYRKRVAKEHTATVERAAERLVTDLLPVLDACEAALGHGSSDVEPIHKSLLDVLEKGGLTRVAGEGEVFDPNVHEAVMHEPGDGDGEDTIVTGILRTGYLWNGRVVRPAMVKVKG